MTSLSLTIVEIIVLMLGAIVLGITIHFFVVSRRNLKATLKDPKKAGQSMNEWKLKYFNDTEIKDKELNTLRVQSDSLRNQLEEASENSKIYSIEADEMRKQNKKLQAELEAARKNVPQTGHAPVERSDYYEQLREAQASLMEHNEKINQLLSNIDVIKETEEKQQEILRDNEELSGTIEELRLMLAQKEQEVAAIRQKANLSKEMSSMLDNAYSEFGILQEKIQKLESQVSSSRMTSLEYEDVKEEHYKLRREFEEQRVKFNAISSENRELQEQLTETEDKLREANFQRQQLQKRVSYLEELNNDLQAVTDANKRLEGQIKRIGELESKLNVIAEERDQLIRRQV
jgi:chromosome segregation ATPase